jgi:hypothetical protein
MPVRQDEIDLWNSFGPGTKYLYPREAVDAMGMNHNRAYYLFCKWADQGRFEWGVSPFVGWKEPRDEYDYPPFDPKEFNKKLKEIQKLLNPEVQRLQQHPALQLFKRRTDE